MMPLQVAEKEIRAMNLRCNRMMSYVGGYFIYFGGDLRCLFWRIFFHTHLISLDQGFKRVWSNAVRESDKGTR